MSNPDSLLQQIFLIDDKITFATMNHKSDIYSKIKDNVSLFTKAQMEQFTRGEFLRMASRKTHENILGNDLYTFTKWDKIAHFTVPINSHNMMIVGVDDDTHLLDIIKKTIELKNKSYTDW